MTVEISSVVQWFELLFWNVWIVLWIGIQTVEMAKNGKRSNLRHIENTLVEYGSNETH